MGKLKLTKSEMPTKTLAAALCASAAAALALDAGTDVQVNIGDTVNTTVIDGTNVTFGISDYLGCWKYHTSTGGTSWYNNHEITFRSDMTWNNTHYNKVMPWAWNKDYIAAADPADHYVDWHFERGYDT